YPVFRVVSFGTQTFLAVLDSRDAPRVAERSLTTERLSLCALSSTKSTDAAGRLSASSGADYSVQRTGPGPPVEPYAIPHPGLPRLRTGLCGRFRGGSCALLPFGPPQDLGA